MERKDRTLQLPPLGHFLLRSRTAEVSASQWFVPRPPAEVCAGVTSDTPRPGPRAAPPCMSPGLGAGGRVGPAARPGLPAGSRGGRMPGRRGGR